MVNRVRAENGQFVIAVGCSNSDERKISICANCDGTGWVCEDHPEVPWNDGKNCCGGAGSPCSCNPLLTTGNGHDLRANQLRQTTTQLNKKWGPM
ncbi:MAG: hypothetical protein O6499_00145 [Candidatus Dadabacteria bacterium]|nr:hypothetical protein [Candidatus Dadabacteria bacterium]